MKSLICILTLTLFSLFQEAPNKPTPIFLNLLKEMEAKNWINDHNRLTKVPIYSEIDRKSKNQFEGFNFYPLSYEQSKVFRMDISRKFDNIESKKALSQVNTIWAFFYRKEPQEKWNTDGIIEQWEFENVQSAKQAFKEISKIANFVYFNTQPYYIIYKNFIYIFHSRAMAFSLEQKPIYEMFKAKMNE